MNKGERWDARRIYETNDAMLQAYCERGKLRKYYVTGSDFDEWNVRKERDDAKIREFSRTTAGQSNLIRNKSKGNVGGTGQGKIYQSIDETLNVLTDSQNDDNEEYTRSL